MKQLLYIIIIVNFFSPAFGQVIINEFSSSNTNNFGGNTDDWLELYNGSTSAVNIGGYYLSDKITNPTKWQVPAGTTIPPNGYVVFLLSGRNVNTGTYQETNFKITQMDQEWVVLANTAGTVIDSYQMLIPTPGGHSRGRSTDGSPTWSYFTTPTPNASNSTTAFDGYCEKPTFSIAPGFYTTAQSLTLSSNTPNTEIRYTIDGSMPTQTSTLYSGPINISNTTVIRAQAYLTSGTNLLPSLVENNSYFINVSHTLNVISVCGNYGTATTGNGTFSPLGGNPIGILSGIEFFDVNQQFKWESTGDMRKHGNDSWAYPQKGIRFHSQDRYGYSSTIDYPLFQRSNRPKYDVIILKAGASDNYPTGGGGGAFPAHIRDAFVQTFAEKNHIDVDTRRYEPCILYVNGKYWGVYEIRERVDTDYTDYYYNQSEDNVDMLRVWGGLNIDAGSDTAWYNLRDFVVNNNMAIASNYQHVKDRLDINSFIDYFIYNQFIVNTDVFNWNTHWWRGRKSPGVKWRYVLWDMDNTFDLGQNYTGLPSTDCNTTPCGYEDILQNPSGVVTQPIMFKRLKENPEFFQKYANRYAYLNTQVLTCQKMIPHLDSLIAKITPEFPGQVNRWGGTVNQWQTNVQKIRDFLNCRCSNSMTSLVDCNSPNLVGPFNVCISSDPPAVGVLTFDSTLVTTSQNCFTYFGGVNIALTAISNNPNYVFDFWTLPNGTLINLDSISPNILIQLADSGAIVAHFKINIIQTNDTTICAGDSVVIAAVPGLNYSWYDANNQFNLIGSNSTVTVYPTITTTYRVITNVGVDSIHIAVNSLPFVNLGPDSLFLCIGDTINKDVSVTNGHYFWNDGDISPTKQFHESGTYSVLVEQNNCISTDSVTYQFYVKPNISLGRDTILCKGEQLLLSIKKEKDVDYLWNNSDSSSSIVIDKETTVSLTANQQLCFNYDTVLVSFENCQPCKAYTPNAITINDDKINDSFEVVFREDRICRLLNFHLEIYNRWGVLEYKSDNINESWTPSIRNAGVYNYVLNYSYTERGKEDSRFESGMINVIR